MTATSELLEASKEVVKQGGVWWQKSQSNRMPAWAMEFRDALAKLRTAIKNAEREEE